MNTPVPPLLNTGSIDLKQVTILRSTEQALNLKNKHPSSSLVKAEQSEVIDVDSDTHPDPELSVLHSSIPEIVIGSNIDQSGQTAVEVEGMPMPGPSVQSTVPVANAEPMTRVSFQSNVPAGIAVSLPGVVANQAIAPSTILATTAQPTSISQ